MGLMAVCTLASAQELSHPLTRNRVLSGAIEQVWSNTLRLVAQSDAIVNAVDPASHLISMTIPVKVEEANRYILEGKDLPPRPQMAHLVIWARSVDQTKTRVFVRAAIGSAGIFLHSSSALEDEIFEALESGKAWRANKPVELAFAHPPERVWRGALNVISSSSLTISAANAEARVLTCTINIPSDAVKQFTAQKVTGYHPADAHLTLWLEPAGTGTRLMTHVLLLEAGMYAPPAIVSNGALEGQLLKTIERSLAGEAMALKVGTTYKRNQDFWWTLFSAPLPATENIKANGAKQQLPTSLDEAWTAALILVTQFAIINRCDRQAGIIGYIAAHPSKGEAKYSVHQMVILLEATNFGVDVYASGEGATDLKDELAVEKLELIEKIATQLFIKEKLKWLLKAQEKTK